jgi:MFS family permease
MSTTSPPNGSRKTFTRCALTLFRLIVGTNLASPWYTVYAQRFGFSPLVLTLVFATYAGALIPALLLAGSAADACGYRRVLLPGAGVALAAALVFAFAGSTGWLFLARAPQGASTGMSSGAPTAALARTEPAGSNRRASLLASLATTAGGGPGPMIAGACASWLPAPTRTCYPCESAALLLAMAGLLTLPSALGRTGAAWRAALPHLPTATRPAFAKSCAVSFTSRAVTAVFLSVVPSYVRSLTGDGLPSAVNMPARRVVAVAPIIGGSPGAGDGLMTCPHRQPLETACGGLRRRLRVNQEYRLSRTRHQCARIPHVTA